MANHSIKTDGKNVVDFLKFYLYIQNNLVRATELSALLPHFMHRRYN